MSSKERLLSAIRGECPDRLPVTTHHVMPSFLDSHMDGATDQEFFDRFGLDPIHWIIAYAADESSEEYHDPGHTELGFLEARRVSSDNWRFQVEKIRNKQYDTSRFSIITPKKTISMVLQSDKHTTWVAEQLIKEKSDIDLIARYMTHPRCDIKAVNTAADQYGARALIRGHIACFDGFGQPGCWQDFSCLYGSTNLIMASMEDPQWVHAFLEVLRERKKVYADSLKGADYDLIELGGGDASTTVISPDIFNEFVAPYDSELIASAQKAGQKIVYHTCGGMMPILEEIAAMNPDAMETFTPAGMGGDANLSDAKRRIGDQVCMIGGFDQFHFFTGCTEEETRKEVRRCFREAGQRGGYILSPSDHFFEADLKLIKAFADEASLCTY